ncbi:MAG TPA: lipid-A-disaccharide synthase [Terriglobales bacterium]|nr:lipid-A-disaccharide synthase [Terriglobales bacterium]
MQLMRFLISAGEASGELYGAGIMQALRRRVPQSQFFGVGGQKMRDTGFETVVDAHDISVVGLAEVVKHLPMIRREFKKLVSEAERRKPDAAILIDFPDFNLRLARELHRLNIPVIYYVSPQLWAWRKGRIRQVQKYVSKMLVIFPFEEEFYREHGVQAEYVGHPLADEPPPNITRETFAAENNLSLEKIWIAVLPGSRRKEVSLNLPGLLDTVRLLDNDGTQFILPVASSLDPEWLRSLIPSNAPVTLVRDARAALLHSRVGIVASGTATVEAALIGTPLVMIYRVTPLTYLLGRRLVKLSHFAMVNLIARREIVPEFVQQGFVPQRVAAKVRELMTNGQLRSDMISALKSVQAQLHSPGEGTAADRAANAVLRTLEHEGKPRLSVQPRV